MIKCCDNQNMRYEATGGATRYGCISCGKFTRSVSDSEAVDDVLKKEWERKVHEERLINETMNWPEWKKKGLAKSFRTILDKQPLVITNWIVWNRCVWGEIYNDERRKNPNDGSVQRTSFIKSIDLENGVLITENTVYHLGLGLDECFNDFWERNKKEQMEEK